MARVRGAQAETSSAVLGAARASSGAATSINSTVLDHVDREQRGVCSGRHPRHQGEGQRGHPAEERDRPPTRDGVRGVDRVDPPDRPQPPADGDRDAQRWQRLERPAQQERPRGRGLEGYRAVGGAAGPAMTPPASETDRDRLIPTTRHPAIGGMVARTARAVADVHR